MAARNIVIVMGRCGQMKQAYGIRFERKSGNEWSATWAFPIKEAVAEKEGYEKSRMDGQFVLADTFPGCPYCSSRGFFLCACGKLACWNGANRKVTCPWCSQSGELSGEITALEGGGDR